MAMAKQPTSTNDDSLQQISRVPRRLKTGDQHWGIEQHGIDACELLEHHEKKRDCKLGAVLGLEQVPHGVG